MTEDQEYREKLYGVYDRQREKLHNASLEVGGRYDRVSLTLSAGSLGLSLTFLEKIAPSPTKESLIILVGAWVLLMASIFAHFWALQYSQRAVEWQIEDLDAEYNFYLYAPDVNVVREEWQELQQEKSPNKFAKWTRWLNTSSKWFLLMGLCGLCCFAIVNVYSKQEAGNGGTEAKKRTKQNGSIDRGLRTPEKSDSATATKKEKISRQEGGEMNNRPIPPPQDGSIKKGTYTPPKNQVPPPPPSTSSTSSSGGSSETSSSNSQSSESGGK